MFSHLGNFGNEREKSREITKEEEQFLPKRNFEGKLNGYRR